MEPTTNLTRISSVNDKEAKFAIKHGASPAEVSSGRSLVTTEFDPKNPMDRRTAMEHAIRSKGAMKGIAMTNQIFPVKWGYLNPVEICYLLHEIELITNQEEPLHSKITNKEGAALLTIMFWFGLDVEKACQACLISPSQKSLPHAGYSQKQKIWSVPSIKINYRKIMTTEEHAAARGLIYRVCLPAPSMAIRIFNSWDKFQETGFKRHRKLFTHEEKDMKEWLGCFIKQHNKKYYGRISASRISNCLFQRLCNSSQGDIVDASLITNHVHWLSETMLFYSARNSQHLCEIFKSVCKDIEVETQREAKAHKLNVTLPPEQQALSYKSDSTDCNYVGSRYCPTDKAAKSLVEGMQKWVVTRWARFLKEPDTIVAFHEAFTVYTSQMLFYASGYRAVRNPLKHGFEIDWESGFLCINDKDNEDHYNSRLVWLPPRCIEQLHFYQIHLNALMADLVFSNRKVFDKIKIQHEQCVNGYLGLFQNSSWKKRRRIQHVEHSEWLPYLFLLSDRNWSELSPTNISQLIKKYMPLPLNVNRHFMRSKLRESDCPSEIVRILLGHWETGQEPWSKYSGMDPFYLRSQLQKHWEPIFNDMGWQPIQGLGST